MNGLVVIFFFFLFIRMDGGVLCPWVFIMYFFFDVGPIPPLLIYNDVNEYVYKVLSFLISFFIFL